MLNGLHDIEWEKLHHAYGPAIDTPWHIRALTSFDAGVRETALTELYSSICHQGTVYEATSYVVPFLLLLLSHPQVQNKTGILYLLADCAQGTPSIRENDDWYQKVCDEKGQDFQVEVKLAQVAVEQALEGVRAGKHLYVSLLEDKKKEIRLAAATALISLSQDVEFVLTALERCLYDRDKSIRPQLLALFATYLTTNKNIPVDIVQKYESVFAARFHPIRQEDSLSDRMLQFVCAIGYLRSKQLSANSRTIDRHATMAANILVTALVRPKGLDQILNSFDLQPQDVIAQSIIGIFSLGVEQSAIHFQKALNATSNVEDAHTIAFALLGSVLLGQLIHSLYPSLLSIENGYVGYTVSDTDGMRETWTRTYPIIIESLNISALSHIQRQAILSVVQTKRIWQFKSNLLEAFGLSNDRKELLEQLQTYAH